MSRVVAGLTKRRIVVREAHPGDGRGVHLTLSRTGQRIYQALIRAALERDETFRRCLSDKEAQVFDKALGKIANEARALIQIEKAMK